jgi:hypothetical protein
VVARERKSTMKKDLETTELDRRACNGVVAQVPASNSGGSDDEEEEFDVDARLTPPPMKMQTIKVRLKYIGKFPPRIFYDPERD